MPFFTRGHAASQKHWGWSSAGQDAGDSAMKALAVQGEATEG